MLQIFILLLLATITYGIYYVICIIIDKKSRKKLSEEELQKWEEDHKKSGKWRANAMILLLVSTFGTSFFIWNDTDGGEERKIQVQTSQPVESVANQTETVEQDNTNGNKEIKYEVIGNHKDSANDQQEIAIKVPEEVLKKEMRAIMIQVAKEELEKSNLAKAKVVAIQQNKEGKTKEKRKQTISELEYTKDGKIDAEKYFTNEFISKYSKDIDKVVTKSMDKYGKELAKLKDSIEKDINEQVDNIKDDAKQAIKEKKDDTISKLKDWIGSLF